MYLCCIKAQWCSGWDSVLPMQEAWVWFLIRELIPHAATKSSQAETKTPYSQIHKERKTLKKGILKAGEQLLCLITITLSSRLTHSFRGQSTIAFFAGKFYFCSELLLLKILQHSHITYPQVPLQKHFTLCNNWNHYLPTSPSVCFWFICSAMRMSYYYHCLVLPTW